ncbi:MAG: hypothetical protein ACEY3D_00565 [Rickettsia sp.]|uniref:hypothetical protein n=1 Tax=Rickettsia sp. TaxID=789 RepID=UPI0039784A9A
MREGVIAWFNFISVILWLDHGIRLKILKLLVFFIIFAGLPRRFAPRKALLRGYRCHSCFRRNDIKSIYRSTQ